MLRSFVVGGVKLDWVPLDGAGWDGVGAARYQGVIFVRRGRC